MDWQRPGCLQRDSSSSSQSRSSVHAILEAEGRGRKRSRLGQRGDLKGRARMDRMAARVRRRVQRETTLDLNVRSTLLSACVVPPLAIFFARS